MLTPWPLPSLPYTPAPPGTIRAGPSAAAHTNTALPRDTEPEGCGDGLWRGDNWAILGVRMPTLPLKHARAPQRGWVVSSP